MPHVLSSKLDSTLRYAAGFYGLGATVLTNISTALTNAAAAATAAATAATAAAAAQTTANTANTAAGTAQTTATTAQTNLTAHIGTGGTSHAAASGSAAGFMTAAHFTRVAGVEDGAQVTSEARVRTALAAATAAIAVNSQKLTLVATPTAGTDAATKGYTDTAVAVASAAAGAAQTTANTAVTNAATAQTAATTANANASQALNTANTAISDAEVALGTANGAQTNLTAHIGLGGTAHANATAAASGFMEKGHYSRVETLKANQASALGYVTAQAFLETPTAFAYASSYAIDTAIKNDYAESDVLTGNITFTFTNFAAGRQGLIAVRQDGTGGRTVTFTAPSGWTIYRDAGTTNLQAAAGADALTVYTYAFVLVGGMSMLLIGKLTPVAA